MTWALRVLLILGSLLTAIYVLRRIRKGRLRMEDSLFWLFFAVVLVLLGVFPGIAISISEWIGFQSPANLVFLVVIFLLLAKLFTMDQRISKLQQQITQMVQRTAIDWKETRHEENS